jgi:DNA-directed RNA polymerase subunit RPC12/RpoP
MDDKMAIYDVWITSEVEDEYMGEFNAATRDEAGRAAVLKWKPDIDIESIESYVLFNNKIRWKGGYCDPTVVARCIKCSDEFTDIQLEGVHACPSCGTKSIPMHPQEDVTLKINWHELRILIIWAENWARECDKNAENDPDHENMLLTIMTIAQRLQQQYPDKTKLTLFSEIRELRNSMDKRGITIQSDLDDDEALGL